MARAFAQHDVDALMPILDKADIAFGRVSDCELLSHHPHLRRVTFGAPSGPVSMPAPAPIFADAERRYGAVPALGEHSEKIRAEFKTLTESQAMPISAKASACNCAELLLKQQNTTRRDAARIRRHFRDHGAGCDPRCAIGRKGIDAGRDRRKGDRIQAMLRRQQQRLR